MHMITLTITNTATQAEASKAFATEADAAAFLLALSQDYAGFTSRIERTA